jgi:protein-S-isoprenylcysteine O-methyltransferase Ste14
MPQSIIFAVVSVGIVALSWSSLRDPRSHGFFRFFAFESILALTLLNLKYWFRDPFSPLQIISWFLLSCSLALAAHGFYLLHRVGRPKGKIENTTILVTQGAYRFIRHPLYSSLLFFGWGAFLKNPSLWSGMLVVAASALMAATAKVEEVENLAKFGADYATYKEQSKMFIPFIW